jgi:hypothetical protein
MYKTWQQRCGTLKLRLERGWTKKHFFNAAEQWLKNFITRTNENKLNIHLKYTFIEGELAENRPRVRNCRAALKQQPILRPR